jgi:hypothetical protein
MAFIQQSTSFGFNSAATNLSVTSSIEIPGCFLYQYLVVPTMTSGYATASTPIWIQGSADNVTFYRMTNSEMTNNTLVAGINDFVVASSVSQRIVPLPALAVRYLRLEVSGTVTNPTGQTNTNAFKLICVSNQ